MSDTDTDENPNYTRVAPWPTDRRRPARPATATATAAATGETPDEEALRAQPRAGARARQIVTSAVEKGSKARARRAAVIAAQDRHRGSGDVESRAGRPGLMDAHLPSLREWIEHAKAGPTRPERREDGTVVDIPLDYPGWQLALWYGWTWGTLAIVAPLMGLIYCLRKPRRTGGLLVLAAVVAVLAYVGSTAEQAHAPAAPAGKTPVTGKPAGGAR